MPKVWATLPPFGLSVSLTGPVSFQNDLKMYFLHSVRRAKRLTHKELVKIYCHCLSSNLADRIGLDPTQ